MAMLCGSLSAQNRDFNGGRPQGMFPPPHGGMMPMGGPGNGPLAGGGIGQFGVKYATAVPDEKDVVVKDKSDSLYHYFVENVKFGKTAKIHFSDDGVECEGMPADVQMAKDGAYLTLASASTEPPPKKNTLTLCLFMVIPRQALLRHLPHSTSKYLSVTLRQDSERMTFTVRSPRK